MLVVYLHKQLHVGKFAQQYAYEAVGQMRVCSQSVSCEGFQAGSEVLAYAAHEQEDERVAVASAQFVADALEGIRLQALVCVTELGTEQADAPRNLQPQHEKRDGGERTVDGIVGTQLYLIVDVQPFHSHEHRSRDDAGQNGVPPLDARVGHQREKQHESQHGKEERRDVKEEGHRLAEQLYVGQQGAEGLKEDADAAGDDHHKGKNQEYAEVVDNLSEDGTRALDEPDSVESLLDVRGKGNERIEKEDDADADEDAAFGVLQVGIDEEENRVGDVGVAFEGTSQPRLDDGVEPEAASYGEHDGQHRDSSKHAAVGEGRSVAHNVVLRDALPRYDKPLHDAQQQPFRSAKPLLINVPYVFETNHRIT